MINKISFQNYKAFTNGEIKIKPITILLGANSVGKSSIMQLFLLLQQTALSKNHYKSALKLHGGFVSLGEGLNLIRKKDKSKTLSLKVDFDSNKIMDELQNDYLSRYLEEMLNFATLVQQLYSQQYNEKDTFIDKLTSLFSSNKKKSFETPFGISRKDLASHFTRENFADLLGKTHDMFVKLDLKKIPEESLLINESIFLRHLHQYSTYRSGVNHLQRFPENVAEYLLAYDFLSGIKNDIHDRKFSINYDIRVNGKDLILIKMEVENNGNEIISLTFDPDGANYKLSGVSSKYLKNVSHKTMDFLKQIFIVPSTIFSFVANNSNDNQRMGSRNSIFTAILRNVLISFNEAASDLFEDDKINYVSPLRAHPKRYYFLDKAKVNEYVDTFDGDAIAEILKEDLHLKHQVNNWFKKFNLQVDVSHLKDVIHSLVINQNSLDLDITDVGFGISQVLPVIIQGFLSHSDSLTLIEQPEIHLHPKMQADLADLFIDIVMAESSKKNYSSLKYLIVETHSEYLLKRLRRRISEGKIPADKVAIYLVDPQTEDKGGTIRELIVEEHGQFEWPKDFYGGELLNDTTEFIKNQKWGK